MRTSFLLTTAVLALAPTIAAAQVQATAGRAPSEAVTAAGAPDQGGLGDIVVTAQRQSENSQRAAVPLNVLQGGALLASGITQSDRLQSLAPALSIEPTSTGNLIFVRGVGNFAVAPNSDPAVAFNYDGVYEGRPTSTTGVFYDLDRVEILKGPQGILYGRNATAGAINILPQQPKLGDLSAYGSFSYGNYNTVAAEGAINAPIGDHGALRLSLARQSHDGYLRDGTSDEKTWAGRAQLKAEVTPDLTIRVAADFAHNGGLGAGIDYIGYYAGTAANFIPSNLPLGTGTNSAAGQAFRTGVTYQQIGNHLRPLAAPYQDNMFYGVNAQIDYKTSAGTLTIIPAWRDSKLNYQTVAGGIDYRDREEDNQYSLEARFAGTRIGPLDYQVGAYLYDEQIRARTELSLGFSSQYQQPNYFTRSYAGFGRATLHIADRLRVVGGLRYTQDNKKYHTTQIVSVISCTLRNAAGQPNCPLAPAETLFTDPATLGFFAPPGPPKLIFNNGGTYNITGQGVSTGALSINGSKNYPVNGDPNVILKTHRLTYRAAVEFDVAPRSLLYASVESGYRSGGFNAAQGFETYQPEFITAYTIGMKNRFFGDRLQANIEGFYWNYTNQQVTHTGLDILGATASLTQNIGKSRIKGVEFDGKFLVTPTTLISTDVQYLDAKQVDFTYIQPGTAINPPITGCAVPSQTAPNAAGAIIFTVNCSGQPSYNSPKWTLNFAGQQTFNFDPFRVVVSADTQYRSSRVLGFAYVGPLVAPGVWMSNAQVQFGPTNDRWSITGFVRNIENKRNPIYGIVGSSGFLIQATTPPRTYGVRVSAKY